MAKFSFKDTIGYKYHSVAFGDFVVIKQLNKNIVVAKLLDCPTFPGIHGMGCATIHTTSASFKCKTPYFDDSLTIIDVLKAHLTLE